MTEEPILIKQIAKTLDDKKATGIMALRIALIRFRSMLQRRIAPAIIPSCTMMFHRAVFAAE